MALKVTGASRRRALDLFHPDTLKEFKIDRVANLRVVESISKRYYIPDLLYSVFISMLNDLHNKGNKPVADSVEALAVSLKLLMRDGNEVTWRWSR